MFVQFDISFAKIRTTPPQMINGRPLSMTRLTCMCMVILTLLVIHLSLGLIVKRCQQKSPSEEDQHNNPLLRMQEMAFLVFNESGSL